MNCNNIYILIFLGLIIIYFMIRNKSNNIEHMEDNILLKKYNDYYASYKTAEDILKNNKNELDNIVQSVNSISALQSEQQIKNSDLRNYLTEKQNLKVSRQNKISSLDNEINSTQRNIDNLKANNAQLNRDIQNLNNQFV